MKIQPYIERLHNSSQYEEFRNKFNDAYLVAGFFVLDFDTGQNIHQIDYYIPSQKKIAAFTLDNEIVVQVLETLTDKVPEELDIQTNVDLEALKGILEDEMKNRSITEEIKKIIAVIQRIEGKKVWILNCILSGMEILKAHVDDETKFVLKMETASVLDYMKKVPMQPPAPQRQATKEDIDKQLDQLDKLKHILEKEKKELEKMPEELKHNNKEPSEHKKHESIEKEKSRF